MKKLCQGTINGVILLTSIFAAAENFIRLYNSSVNCTDGETECTGRLWLIAGTFISVLLLFIASVIMLLPCVAIVKPLWGRTIKGLIVCANFFRVTKVIIRLYNNLKRISDDCTDGERECTRRLWTIAGISISVPLLLCIAIVIIRQCLISCFPIACGHRRCIFTGRSSKSLRDILLTVDKEIPNEEKLRELRDKSLPYLNDIKFQLESTMITTTFQFIFSGSTIERYGVPFMMTYQPNCCGCKASCSIHALDTDLDVMFCSVADSACFSGQGNILVEPLVSGTAGFTGYATLSSLEPGFEGRCISSKIIRDQAKSAVENASATNLPGVPCCWGMVEVPPTIQLDSKGPAMKINIAPIFEADITLCCYCREWPTVSDWPSRQRYWPSLIDAQRIMSLGCHLVAKPAPDDDDETSWRFSFSVAEVELSKLVPDTARKCFLAMKIILKDHLQPIVSELGSYHIKTIFLNTLEKIPVSFWVEKNIEECFLTLMTELRDCLVSRWCSHHWFSFINLFDIDGKKLQILARKIERIIKDPAPFIFDDGSCCLSPCCLGVRHYNFSRRSSQQFFADYEEVTISVHGDVVPLVKTPVSGQFLESATPGTRGKSPQRVVVCLPPTCNTEHECRPGPFHKKIR